MKYKCILIPTDGSASSEQVIELVCSMKDVLNTTIHVIYIMEIPRNLPLGAIIPEKAGSAKAALQNAQKIADRYDVRINTSTIYARTSEDTIISTSEELKCDVIAIAQDNRKLRIFSNMALNINQRAKCNVWIFNNKL
ncbi:MAG: universal stress protein [Ruminiclostridium sp.]|nr:universal stress protein [Ruminiclostridium sp.]